MSGENKEQLITFFAKWNSPKVVALNSFTFSNETMVHKAANVMFPFAPTSTKWDGRTNENFDYYYSYANFSDDAINLSKIPETDTLVITLQAGLSGSFHQNISYNDTLLSNTYQSGTPVPPNTFSLQCGVVDYAPSQTSAASAAKVEVTNSSFPYVQMQATLTLTDDNVMGTCVGTVYGNPIPFFSVSNSIQQGDSNVCTANTPPDQLTSLAFANMVIAFGVMNLCAKASSRISEVGWIAFFKTFGARVLDL